MLLLLERLSSIYLQESIACFSLRSLNYSILVASIG